MPARHMGVLKTLEQHEPQYGDSADRENHPKYNGCFRQDAFVAIAKPNHGGSDKAN
jgi:hypothetical protein